MIGSIPGYEARLLSLRFDLSHDNPSASCFCRRFVRLCTHLLSRPLFTAWTSVGSIPNSTLALVSSSLWAMSITEEGLICVWLNYPILVPRIQAILHPWPPHSRLDSVSIIYELSSDAPRTFFQQVVYAIRPNNQVHFSWIHRTKIPPSYFWYVANLLNVQLFQFFESSTRNIGHIRFNAKHHPIEENRWSEPNDNSVSIWVMTFLYRQRGNLGWWSTLRVWDSDVREV